MVGYTTHNGTNIGEYLNVEVIAMESRTVRIVEPDDACILMYNERRAEIRPAFAEIAQARLACH